MKNSIKKIFVAVIVGVIVTCTFYKVKESNRISDIVLANIEALAMIESGEDGYGCGGNPTFIPNEALRTANCWNGGTHKKCKSENNVCCDPSQQSDCKGVI